MIAGKPDYVINDNNSFYPVEYKSGVYDSIRDNHVFQLAAYCHLVEESFGVFVPFGVIVYSDEKSFRVPFDPKIRFEFEEVLKEMRYLLRTDKIFRNHDNKHKCLNCSFKEFCDFKIK